MTYSVTNLRTLLSARNWWITVFAVLSICAILALGSSLRAKKKGDVDVVVDTSGVRCINCDWDFGELDAALMHAVDHDFSIYNASDECVSIEGVITDCGCMKVKEVPKQIDPHSAISIVIRYTVGVKSGPIQKTVLVKLRDGNSSVIPLRITGTVATSPLLHFFPSVIDFGVVPEGETSHRIVQLMRYDGSDVALQSIACRDRLSSVKYSVEGGGKKVSIHVVVQNDGSIAAEVDNALIVKTSHLEFPTVEIPIKARFQTMANYFVPSIAITGMKRGTERLVPIFRGTESDVENARIDGFDYDGDVSISAAIVGEDKLQGNDVPHAAIRLSADAPIAKLSRGRILIRRAGCDEQVIEIPIVIQAVD